MKHFASLITLAALTLLWACTAGGSGESQPAGDTIAMRYATNLTLVDHGSYVRADFRNPWDTTRTLQTYLLVPRDSALPESLPKGTVVRVPLQRSVVYTSVHAGLISELGHIDDIAGACDTRYMRQPPLQARIADGRITDCGNTMAPNIERIMQLRPDAILLSAYEDSNDHNKVAQTGVPIIDCTDYMEVSPLARAEWMRFFGRLYGEGVLADSLFEATEREYLAVKSLAAGAENRPSVLSEMIYSGTWGVPGALSTTGIYIEDAGGTNPFADYKQSGSVMLAPEAVLYRAKDADIWMLKYSRPQPMTLADLGGESRIYSQFAAYRNGNVYGCNTDRATYFEDAAFHPQWILREYLTLIHPELGGDSLRYYTKLVERAED